jgi:lipopolysaccharide export LptBFGC system permease protein LptF
MNYKPATKPLYILQQEIARNNRKKSPRREPTDVSKLILTGLLFILAACVTGATMTAAVKVYPIAQSNFRQIFGESKAKDAVAEKTHGVSKIIIAGNHSREVKQFATLLRNKGYQVVMVSPHYSNTVYSVRGHEARTFDGKIELIEYLSAIAKTNEASK